MNKTIQILCAALVVAAAPGVTFAAPAAGALCGNAKLDINETCDDGNQGSGDGCSSGCQVEFGYECSAPVQPLTDNSVIDGDFEFGGPSNIWNEISPTGEPVLCSVDSCPNEPGARRGAWWARFGSAFEPGVTSIKQELVIDNSAAELQFDVQTYACGGRTDVLSVLLDGTPVFVTNGEFSGCQPGSPWRHEVVDLVTAPGGPYNDGGVHTLELIGTTNFANNGPSHFAVDNVFVGRPFGPPTPGRCGLLSNVIQYEDFDPPVAGDLGSLGFSTFEFGENPLPWGTTDDGVCGSGDIPPGNFTGGAGEAACIDANAGGGGQVLSYLCTPELDFSNFLMTQLSFLLNVQFGNGQNDLFAVVAGIVPPDASSLGNYTALYATFESIGVFGEPQGAQIDIDLSPLDGQPQVWLCYVFFSTQAFYAQVDNSAITFEECIDDTDKDKLQGCSDNCSAWPNPDQTDSDGDGYGNACDADISRGGSARVEGGNGNDCQVNVLDLGVLRSAFFSDPSRPGWNPDADLTGDLQVNVEDLGRFKQLFFQPVGPSGVTNICGAAP